MNIPLIQIAIDMDHAMEYENGLPDSMTLEADIDLNTFQQRDSQGPATTEHDLEVLKSPFSSALSS